MADIPTKEQEAAMEEFSRRRGAVILNRKSMEAPWHVWRFAVFFRDFVPLGIKDIGRGRLVYTGLSWKFRPLLPGERTPCYHVSWHCSSADGCILHFSFDEMPERFDEKHGKFLKDREKRSGWLARLFKKKGSGK